MAAPRNNTSVIVSRSKKTIALPPATLGFSALTSPDTYDPEKPSFKANFHYDPKGLAALQQTIADECVGAMMPKLLEEARKAGIEAVVTKKPPQEPADWIEGKLKTPKETAPIQLPYIVIMRKAHYKDRDGNQQTRKIGCWSARNQVLDLNKLRLGMGSTVQAIVHPNMFFSKLIGFPQPSLQLVGLRVLKLQQWGGSAPPSMDDEEVRAVLGADFDVDDLAQFMAGADEPVAGEPDHGDDPDKLIQNML